MNVSDKQIIGYYTKLIAMYEGLLQEVDKLNDEEKKFHFDMLEAIDRNKMARIKEHIEKIKDI